MFKLIHGVFFALLMALYALPVYAIEEADFLEGTRYTKTTNGCEMYAQIGSSMELKEETVPDTLDPTGFHGWQSRCEFTKIWEHKPDEVWMALMYCTEDYATKPRFYSFTKKPGNPDPTFEVATQGQENPDVYFSCRID